MIFVIVLYYIILTCIIFSVYLFFSISTNYLFIQDWSDTNIALNQIPFSSWLVWTGVYPDISSDNPISDRKQRGYFLHITDMHIDEDYIEGGSIKTACHKLPKSNQKNYDTGGKYGASGEACDAPVILAKETLDFIAKEYKDKLDFVIWTGDNAKHDWDEKHKRKRKHVYELNQLVTDMMIDTFWIDDHIPVIPSFGNNDVFPHNQIGDENSDSDLLSFYERLFRVWIPIDQRPTFRQGGYYNVKVAPRLNVISLNSLYFYTKNEAVGNCLHPTSPGAVQLTWFLTQLIKARKNGDKVYVIGHVPPSPRDYKGTCLADYLRLSVDFQDVIGGHFFAHLNMDHFLMFDGTEDRLKRPTIFETFKNKTIEEDDHLFHTSRNIKEYMDWLREMYTGIDLPDHKSTPNSPPPLVVIQVAPSVLPVYHPSFRIYQYQIEEEPVQQSQKPYGTLLGFTQYFANLTKWNNLHSKSTPLAYEIEYNTKEAYGLDDLSVESYFQFAKAMMENTEAGNKLWTTYQNHMLIKTENFSNLF